MIDSKGFHSSLNENITFMLQKVYIIGKYKDKIFVDSSSFDFPEQFGIDEFG